MTVNQFRKLALGLPEVVAAAHMGHPDFRVGGKVFATLAWPAVEWAMVRLTPEQQGAFVRAHPQIFRPVKGGWGERGATNVLLAAARVGIVRLALWTAWRNVAPKRLAAEHDDDE